MKRKIYAVLGIVMMFSTIFVPVPAAREASAATNNLVAHWKFNEGSGTRVGDSSSQNNTGVFESGVTWTSGKEGKAAHFNGSNGRAVTETSGDFNTSDDFTMSMWVYPTQKKGVLVRSSSAVPTPYSLLVDASGRLVFRGGLATEWNEWTTNTSIKLNAWNHIAVSYQSGSTQTEPKIYLNGAKKNISHTNTISGSFLTQDNTMYIGNNGSLRNGFAGKVDEVKVFNTVLGASDIRGLYEEVTTDNLVAHWKFNEGSGTRVGDLSSQDNEGVLEQGVTWTNGTEGKAVRFDGDTGRLKMTTSGAFNSKDDITVSMWMYPTKNKGVILRNSSMTPGPYSLLVDTDGTLVFRGGTPTEWNVWKTSRKISLNKWNHVAVVFESGSTATKPKIYIDGVSRRISSEGNIPGDFVVESNTLYIGNNGSLRNGFTGKIDDIQVYSKLLDATKIKNIFEAHTPAVLTRPNIVVFMTDDQDDSVHNLAIQKTKKLIAEQGVTFTNSFVENPLCCPSRVAYLTGQTSHNNGVYDNVTRHFNGRSYNGGYVSLEPTADNTLPVWVQDAGYTTAMIGKYVNGYSLTGPPAPGWDKWFLTFPRYFNYTANEDGVTKNYGSDPEDYVTDVLTRKAVSFVENQRNSDDPFFMTVFHPAPHVDVSGFSNLSTPPAPRHKGNYANAQLPPLSPSFNEVDVSDKPSFGQDLNHPRLTQKEIAEIDTRKRNELESLLAVDESVEAVIDALEATGKLDNTIIVFTSDNGYLYGEHRKIGKRAIYEESIRVPLLMRGPGIDANEKRTELVNNLDVVATIVDLADANPKRTLDGKSLVSLFEEPSTVWRSALLVEGSDQVRVPTDNEYILGIYGGIRTDRYTYAEHEVRGGGIEKELYDLQTDPYQMSSKHADPAYNSIRQDLASKLQTLLGCSGTSCWMTAGEAKQQNSAASTNRESLLAQIDMLLEAVAGLQSQLAQVRNQ